MADILAQWKHDLFGRDYSYEAAVQNGFEGTEEEWYDHLSEWHKDSSIWKGKNHKLEWISETDIDEMFDGVYKHGEQSDYDFSYSVVGESLVIQKGVIE